MPLFIINDDITKLKVDAIVNAANRSLLGGGGVDGCIHRAAGPELLEECKTLNGCEVGEAKITKGYKLPAKYVIHTVGPYWKGGDFGEAKLLESCYYRSLKLALENECESIAFPMISTGVYGYPKYEAMQIAQKTINNFLDKLDVDLDVYIVLFGKDVSGYFDADDNLANYLISNGSVSESQSQCESASVPNPFDYISSGTIWGIGVLPRLLISNKVKESKKSSVSLNSLLNNPGESFSSMVMRKIKEKGISEVECYRAANLNRQIFSKIRSSAGENEENPYQPTKITAMSFAIALKLPLDESIELLGKAGYAFSKSNKCDLIVQYCIENRIYEIDRVNKYLFTYQQPLLGSKCY